VPARLVVVEAVPAQHEEAGVVHAVVLARRLPSSSAASAMKGLKVEPGG
jgi:hypothetical protein